jgi:midasin
MNLAQQSVLEGLNAILDHRRTVYIPELNKEFECHPDFYVFACQNPSQSSSSVGGRKTLPKSFLNRFNKIYLEELTQEDYNCILNRQISSDSQLAHLNVPNLLKFSQEVEKQLQKDKREET